MGAVRLASALREAAEAGAAEAPVARRSALALLRARRCALVRTHAGARLQLSDGALDASSNLPPKPHASAAS